jgi:hypothetical protein
MSALLTSIMLIGRPNTWAKLKAQFLLGPEKMMKEFDREWRDPERLQGSDETPHFLSQTVGTSAMIELRIAVFATLVKKRPPTGVWVKRETPPIIVVFSEACEFAILGAEAPDVRQMAKHRLKSPVVEELEWNGWVSSTDITP